MAKLILSVGDSVIREIPLDKERITIGRKPQNDIQIENLAVSGEHARIVTILNDSFLEDLGSTNGTLVNGNAIKKHILQSGDVIEISRYKLKYVADAPSGKTSVEDFEKTMVLRATPAKPVDTPLGTADVRARLDGAAPSPATPGAQGKPADLRPLGAIQVLTGPSAGAECELVKNLTTLGKPRVQVAVIARRPQGYFITHVEGAAFPIVNGKTLDTQAYALADHDVIELAGVKMEFFLKSA